MVMCQAAKSGPVERPPSRSGGEAACVSASAVKRKLKFATAAAARNRRRVAISMDPAHDSR